MSDKEVFMRVQELGDLYLYDVLLSYIYPRVFVCEDSYNGKYVFYEVSSKDNKDVWLVAKISKNEYYSLVDCKKAIQKVYENKTGFNLFSISKIYGENEDSIDLSLDTSEWIKKLPEKPVYAEKEIIDDVAEKTLAVARETGATTFGVRLFAGTDRHFVPQNIMSDLCSGITSLINSVFGQRREEPICVSTAAGSCVIRFSFPEQINLFNESDAANAMDVVNEVLGSETLSDGLSKVKNKESFIKSYSKILGTLRKTGSDVQFTTASPNSTQIQKVELPKDVVRSRYEDVKDIYNIEKTTEVFKGTLIGLDMKSKRFKLQLDDGTIKTGVITNEILESGTFELPKIYDATIDVEKYIDDNQKVLKEKYYLKGLWV